MRAIILLVMVALMSQMVSANNNTFEDNDIDDVEYGIYIKDKVGIIMTDNRICSASVSDIYVENSEDVSGTGNDCETTTNYNDTGATGCTSTCVLPFAGGAPKLITEKPKDVVAVKKEVEKISKLEEFITKYWLSIGVVLTILFCLLAIKNG